MNITDMVAAITAHYHESPLFLFGLVLWEQVAIAFALLIVSAIITAATTKAPQVSAPPEPSVLTDFDFPQIDEGVSQTVVFGDVWLTGWQVLYYGNLRSEGIPAPKAKGKK